MQSRNLLLIILGCVIVFGIIFLFIRYTNEQTRRQEIVNEHKYNQTLWKVLERQNAKKAQDQSSVAVSSDKEVEYQCLLKRNDGVLPEVILRSQYCYSIVERWNDLLFFQEGDGYNKENIRLVAYDIHTGVKRVLYDLGDYQSDFSINNLPYVISSIKVIQDKLYFGLGGYMTDNALYSLSLPVKELAQPERITSNKNFSAIRYEYGQYWLVGGVGDAGVSHEVRALFYPGADTFGKIIETGFDMGTGTKVIGAEGNKVYIAEFVDGPIDPQELLPTMSEIKRIYTLDINSLQKGKNIFTKDDVSFPVHSVYYQADRTRFIFFSDKQSYLYDFSSKKVKLIGTLEKDIDSFSQINDSLCFNDTESLDIQNDTINHSDTVCGTDPGEGDLKTKFPTLNLPESFILETH